MEAKDKYFFMKKLKDITKQINENGYAIIKTTDGKYYKIKELNSV